MVFKTGLPTASSKFYRDTTICYCATFTENCQDQPTAKKNRISQHIVVTNITILRLSQINLKDILSSIRTLYLPIRV